MVALSPRDVNPFTRLISSCRLRGLLQIVVASAHVTECNSDLRGLILVCVF